MNWSPRPFSDATGNASYYINKILRRLLILSQINSLGFVFLKPAILVPLCHEMSGMRINRFSGIAFSNV